MAYLPNVSTAKYRHAPYKAPISALRQGTILSARTHPSAPRPVTHKKVQKMRFNWFIVGALCGVGASFFMNLMVTSVIIPEYQHFVSRSQGLLAIAEHKPNAGLASKQHSPLVSAQSSHSIKTATVAAIAPITYPRTLALKISAGDTLLDVLIDNHVQEQEAHQVVAALRKSFNPGMLRIGQKISMTLARHEKAGDSAAVKELAIKLPNLSTVELERLQDGTFSVAAVKEPTQSETRRAMGKVRTSLFQAAADAGISNATMGELVQAFAYDVDFQRDIHPGDSIEVLMQRKVTKDGRVAEAARPDYALLKLRGKTHEIFRFTNAMGQTGWYTASGQSVKKSLLRTPINAARISSGFGMRKHPIMGYSRMHRGIDFAAATGTPILAAGDGIVAKAGWSNGYGNLLQIKHNATFTTAYGHTSRFAAGIRPGVRVRQGQVVAYVGTTGMSTGPHLHYEILQNGAQVNPAGAKFNTSVALTGRELQNFRSKTAAVKSQFARLTPNSSVALNAGANHRITNHEVRTPST